MSSSPPPPPTNNDGAEEEEGGGSGGGRALSYGAAEYWDARYVEEGGAPYDWYQRYDALRPFVRRFAPPASRLLMIGCGSARTRNRLPSPVTCGYLLFAS
jgi:EEF1A lysine methyltransferase 4